MKLIIILVFLLVIVIFTVYNAEPVSINFLMWSFAVSKAILIFVSLFAGIIIGVLMGMMKRPEKPQQTESERGPQ